MNLSNSFFKNSDSVISEAAFESLYLVKKNLYISK